MNASYISTQDYPSHQYIGFGIEAAKNPKHKELFAIYNSFCPLCDLSYGKVYKRNDIAEFWHVDPDNNFARLISEDRLKLFLRWDEKTLLPDEAMYSRLIEIGSLPSGEYSLSAAFLQFPCRVKTANGQIIDLCLLHFSVSPPYQPYFKNILLLDDIIDIEPSELSLPYDLRMESMLAGEIRMSFYPFMLKTNTGELLLYNGITEFASNGEIKGRDIECQVPFSYESKYKVAEVSFNDITFVVGKWGDRLQNLHMSSKKLLEDKEATKRASNQYKNSTQEQDSNIFIRIWKWIKGE